MRVFKKIILIVVGLAIFIVILNFGLNLWLNHHFPKIISENNKSDYHITYKNLKISFWSSNIEASNIIIVPKLALKNSKEKAGIYSKIASIKIEKFKIWDILFNDKIKAENITIKNPEFLLYKKNKSPLDNPSKKNAEVVNPFKKIIVVSNVYVTHGDLKIVHVKNNKPVLSVSNINFQIKGIVTSDAILKNKMPVIFNSYKLDCDSLYYRINDNYTIKVDKIESTNTTLLIKKIALLPEYSRKIFVSKLPAEKDLFVLNTELINIKRMDWGFINEKFFFKTNIIEINQLNSIIYRNKIPKDDLTKKHLYNKLLRDLDFNLSIDTLLINNSRLQYEEEINYEKGPGILTFDKFNLIATNIKSGFEEKNLKNLKIKINCQFMKTSPLKIDWTFNVLDKNDGFNIKGSILNFDTKKITPFLKPNNNVTTEGVFEEIYFNFKGNDFENNGNFALKYRDLKLTVFKKKDKKKISKLKTAIGNLLIKNNSENEIKNVKVNVKRIKEKSFYNFLWRSLADGLKQILI